MRKLQNIYNYTEIVQSNITIKLHNMPEFDNGAKKLLIMRKKYSSAQNQDDTFKSVTLNERAT